MSLKRRAHRKSRNGCRECKRRRIKCDETKPHCGHCVRHGIHCVYPESAGASPASGHASPSASIEPGPTPPRSSPLDNIPCLFVDDGSSIPTGSSFNLKDMALMHHWTLVTSVSIVRSPQLDHYWQVVYPTVAFEHAYVMHSLLSITALHAIHLQPSNKHTHLCIAAHHHTLALRGFREDINSIGPQNSEAIFASATLAFFYAFITFGTVFNGQGEGLGDTMRTSRILGTDWIPLVRGLKAVLHPLREHLGAGPLRSLLSLGNFFELDLDTQAGPNDDKFSALKEIWLSDVHAQVYDETVDLLRKISAWMMQFRDLPPDQIQDVEYNREWSGPFMWLFLCSDQYIILQQQRQPVALLVFAYFGALLPRLHGYWWADGCGKSVVGAVEECLGPYWEPWLAWPKQMVGLE